MAAAAAAQDAAPKTAVLKRPCGHYERLFVSTSNLGEPLYMTYVARIEKPFDAVHAATARRVQELIDSIALLSARVGDMRTRHPYWEVAQRRTPADVIHIQSCLHAPLDAVREDVHTRAQAHAERTFSLPDGRFWNVGLWRAHPHAPEQDVVFLSQTILHVATDGLGGRFLFEALIAPDMPKHLVFLPGLPPTLEDTTGYRLTAKQIRELARIAFSLLLPRPIRHRLTWPPHWPVKIQCHPKGQPTGRKLFTLDGTLVPKLKAVAKANDLATINPVIFEAALAALFSVTAPDDSVDSNKRLPFHLAIETPMTFREPEKLGHSSCVGNFSGAHLHRAQLRRTTLIWPHARDYAESIKVMSADPNASLQFLAMSKLVPDPKRYKPTPEAPTPWEAFMLKEMKKKQPFRSSLDLVNLGAIRGPKNGRVSEISLSGTIDQTYSAFLIACGSFISSDYDFPSHMALTLSWRRNCIPDDTVVRFMSNFRKMFTLMADGRVGDKATFGQVAEMLKEDGLKEWPSSDLDAFKARARAQMAAASKEAATPAEAEAAAAAAAAPTPASPGAATVPAGFLAPPAPPSVAAAAVAPLVNGSATATADAAASANASATTTSPEALRAAAADAVPSSVVDPSSAVSAETAAVLASSVVITGASTKLAEPPVPVPVAANGVHDGGAAAALPVPAQ